VPSLTGTSCDSRDVCVVSDAEKTIKWSLKLNETN
jgi:hypothetical protein